VFYYSGHGVRLEGNFAASGAEDPEADGKDEALAIWGSGENGSLLLDDEMRWLAEQLRAGRSLWVFDACHSGTMLGGESEGVAVSAAGGRAKSLASGELADWLEMPTDLLPTWIGDAGLAPGKATPGLRRVVVSAAGEHELSWLAAENWPGGDDESVFTHYFAEQLKAAGPETTFGQAVSVTVGPVSRYTKQHFGKAQSPRVEGTDVDTSIRTFLRKW
jgi:caspase domain-containing protein